MKVRRRSALGIIFLALPFAAIRPAADPVPSVELSFLPSEPVQGTLFAVEARVPGETTRSLEGRFTGEPLHFERQPDGRYRALAGVPIDSVGPLPLEVYIDHGSRTDTVRSAVVVASGSYRMERLTVAPRFGSPPEPALAARIAREAERAREVSRRSHDTPRLWQPGEFVQPRESRITSGFGNGREFNGEVQSRHMGTDFAGAVGAPVRAAARGVVALVDSFHLGGNVVYIDHGAGLVTGYLHLSRTDVAAGDTVSTSQTIGGVGATGRVTGPHLHWIVRYGVITVDPMSLLGLELGSGG
jgi:hypothetical protein